MSDHVLLDDFDVARLLGISRRCALKLIRERKLPRVVLPDGTVRFDIDDLRQWIADRKEGSQHA